MAESKTYAKLGDLEFYVFDGIKAFEESTGYDVVEHELISGKNVVQVMGERLKTLLLSVAIRSYFDFIDANYILQSLREIKQTGEPQRLFFADGSYSGQYILTDMKTTILKTYITGEIAEADVAITLKEYISRDTVEVSTVEKKLKKTKTKRKRTRKDTNKENEQRYERVQGPPELIDGKLVYPVIPVR